MHYDVHFEYLYNAFDLRALSKVLPKRLAIITCTKPTTKMLESYVCKLLGWLINGCLLRCAILKNYSCLQQKQFGVSCILKLVRVLFKSHMSCNNDDALIVNTEDCVSKVLCFCYRLKEIEMSEYDATTYDRFSGAVRRQVQSLRIILDSLQVNTSSSPTPGVFRALSGLKLVYWFLPCALEAAVTSPGVPKLFHVRILLERFNLKTHHRLFSEMMRKLT